MNNIFRKISALCLSVAMAAGFMPAAMEITASAAAYDSVYPDRIADSIVYDGLENYAEGTAVTKIGEAWWDPGNNQNEFAIVGEHDGTKVIYYEGEHNYSTFCSPGKEKLSDELWIDVDVKLPEDYCRYHFQIGDFTHPDRAVLIFYKDETRLVASGVQNPAGSTSSITLTNDVPQNEWFTLSLWFNAKTERFRVYINGVQVGGEMNFNYKFICTTHGTEGPEAAFAKMSFAHRGIEELYPEFCEKLYLDNFRLGYAREINSVSTMEITLDKRESYTFPETLELELNNGEKRGFAVTFTPQGEVLDTNTLGSYKYTAQIEHYSESVDVWFYVKERTISSIETIYEKVYKDENYTLPATVRATMDDGGTKHVGVVWDGVADLSAVGTTIYTGTVEGYGTVTLNLEVLANAVLRADDLYIGIPKDGIYEKPVETPVIFTNHKFGKAAVTWEAAADSVDTSTLGKYEFRGNVEGCNEPITLHVTVYEDDPDLDYIFDVLKEYYDNCLTIARDRSQWFSEEYAQGYDPATPDIISDNPHSPLFSMGIDRDTNTHALWPRVTAKMPLKFLQNKDLCGKDLWE